MTNEEEITMDKRPIGVFDSGVGGLTVVKQIMKKHCLKKTLFILEIQQDCLMAQNLKKQ